nr:MAG TPA: hypothetical protein [Caudoviricetes sp.]
MIFFMGFLLLQYKSDDIRDGCRASGEDAICNAVPMELPSTAQGKELGKRVAAISAEGLRLILFAQIIPKGLDKIFGGINSCAGLQMPLGFPASAAGMLQDVQGVDVRKAGNPLLNRDGASAIRAGVERRAVLDKLGKEKDGPHPGLGGMFKVTAQVDGAASGFQLGLSIGQAGERADFDGIMFPIVAQGKIVDGKLLVLEREINGDLAESECLFHGVVLLFVYHSAISSLYCSTQVLAKIWPRLS